MSVLKVTADEVVNVCACGAENSIPMADVVVNFDTVVLPVCPRCQECRTCITAQPYDDAWENLSDDAIRRYAIAQVLHHRAINHSETKTFHPQQSKDEIRGFMESENRYEFVDEAVAEFHADVHPMKKQPWEKFKETGEITKERDKNKDVPIRNPKLKKSIKSFVKGGDLDRSEKIKEKKPEE